MSTKGKRETPGELTKQIQLALREATARLHQLNDAVGAHVDLQAGDLELLDEISRRGPVSALDLATATGTHPATLTGILDRLERGGWLFRGTNPDDRRKVRIEARYERAGELLRLYGPMNRSIAKLCSGFDADQLAAIRDFLRSLGADASKAGAQARIDLGKE